MPLLEERTVPRRPTYALHEERDLYQIHFYIIVDFLIHTLRGERDVPFQPSNLLQVQFQLTRSVGSVTYALHTVFLVPNQFQLTRSVGSVTFFRVIFTPQKFISTHTLRGERDN